MHAVKAPLLRLLLWGPEGENGGFGAAEAFSHMILGMIFSCPPGDMPLPTTSLHPST